MRVVRSHGGGAPLESQHDLFYAEPLGVKQAEEVVGGLVHPVQPPEEGVVLLLC
jgi:hypothetical protein